VVVAGRIDYTQQASLKQQLGAYLDIGTDLGTVHCLEGERPSLQEQEGLQEILGASGQHSWASLVVVVVLLLELVLPRQPSWPYVVQADSEDLRPRTP